MGLGLRTYEARKRKGETADSTKQLAVKSRWLNRPAEYIMSSPTTPALSPYVPRQLRLFRDDLASLRLIKEEPREGIEG